MGESGPVKTSYDPVLAMARQSLYRLATLSLADPKIHSWRILHDARAQELATDAAAIVRQTPGARSSEPGRGELPLSELDPRPIFASLPDSETALNALYERTFGLVVCGQCPPYETEYVNSKLTFQRSEQLADISGFYRAFGLRIPSRHSERCDHIVLELEFMAVVLGLERQAAGSDDPHREEHLAVCRDAQVKFFEHHLAWWVPAFARLLTLEDPGGYYGAVARFLSAWVGAERDLLGIEAPVVPVGRGSVERPEECDGCLLGA